METFAWLFQEIIAHWVIWVLASTGAAMLGVVRKYWPSVAGPVLYGMAGGGIILICLWLPAQSARQLEVFTNGRPARPYFTHSRASIYAASRTRTVLTVSVQNNERPASQVTSQILLLDELLDPTIEPIFRNRTENANDVGRFAVLNRHIPVNVEPNTRIAYVLFEIQYKDAITNAIYSQAWFLKFGGSSQDGTFMRELFEASSAEKTRIEGYVANRGIPRLVDLGR